MGRNAAAGFHWEISGEDALETRRPESPSTVAGRRMTLLEVQEVLESVGVGVQKSSTVAWNVVSQRLIYLGVNSQKG